MKNRIAATIWKIKAILCVLVGHSRICTSWFGYRYCGRCGDLLGDSLASQDMGLPTAVIVEHSACAICGENKKQLTWKDKLFAPKVG